MAFELIKKRNIIWTRRCCRSLGGATQSPCTDPTQPYGSFDLKYYVEATGEYTDDGEYDVYSKIKVHFWMEASDYGFTATCPSENCKSVSGCSGNDILECNRFASGVMWRQIYTWDSTCVQPSRDLGTYELDGVLSVRAGETAYLTVARAYSCGKYGAPIQIALSKPDVDYTECVAPTITSMTCTPSYTNPTQGLIDVDGTWGKNINKQGKDIAVYTQSWTVTPGGRTGNTNTITGLQPNTTYSVTATRSNGCRSASATRSFTTLCGNTLSNCQSLSSTSLSVDCTIEGGNGVYAPTTYFRYRVSGELGWQILDFSTKTKTKTTATLTGLQRETYYEIQAYTETTAGTYYGNTLICRTAAGINASITSADPTSDTTAEVCYNWSSNCAPVTTQVYYRVKNGFDPTWLKSEAFTSGDKNGTNCVTLIGLVPNYTVYECYVHVDGCDGEEADSSMWEFTTPAMAKPDNFNCETLEYMLSLICQALEAIKEGDRTIFANQASKEKCDPYSENPTMATFWSRFNRWAGAVACLACEMIDYLVKSGGKDQYFVGEIGWVDTLDEVKAKYDDDDSDADRLPKSSAVYRFIKDSIHEVWHYHGAVDYILDDLTDVPSDAKIVLNLADNKIYEKSGSSWKVSDTIEQPDDFAVYHVNYASTTKKLGKVRAESAYYYFEETWNNLDSDMADVGDRVEVIEKGFDQVVMSNTPDRSIEVVDKSFDFDNAKDGTIYFVKEKMNEEPVYHTVRFVTKTGLVLQEQKVLHGAMAQQPSVIPTKENCLFGGWVKKGDVAPECRPVAGVIFDSDGGDYTPKTQVMWEGEYAAEPADPEKEGYAFGGWYEEGTEEPECEEVYEVAFNDKKNGLQFKYVTKGRTVRPIDVEPEGECKPAGWYDINDAAPACEE